MERATGTCMYTHVCINTDAPIWMFRLVYIYSYVSQVVHPTLGIKAPPRCTSSFSPFLSAPLTPSFTPFITRPSPALSLSLHPYSPPRGRPSFAPHVDESQTRPTVTGRALNWAEGANAKVLPRFSPPTRKGNDPLFVRGKERERGERMEGGGGGGRAVIRSTAEFTWRVTGTGRWWDGSMKEDGRITCIVVKMIEPNRIPPVWRLSASITITEFRLLFLTY